jgi:hypothetical protein
VVVQADPKTRQYNVMAFRYRRSTLRNRKFLGGTDALSRYGVRDNNDEKMNWMSKITKNMAELDRIFPDQMTCSAH